MTERIPVVLRGGEHDGVTTTDLFETPGVEFDGDGSVDRYILTDEIEEIDGVEHRVMRAVDEPPFASQ